MIIDTLANAALYHGLGARIKSALDWLQTFSADTADGRYPIDGDDVFALVQSYQTSPRAEKKLETHNGHIDVQFVARGAEMMEYVEASGLAPLHPYDAERDFTLFEQPAHVTAAAFRPGMFAIYFPSDAHKPGCDLDETVPVKKVVIKVRVS